MSSDVTNQLYAHSHMLEGRVRPTFADHAKSGGISQVPAAEMY